MKSILATIPNRRYKFTSKYNVKLYKKCLSLKLFHLNPNLKLKNLVVSSDSKMPIKTIRSIYTRKERIPFRIFKFFYSLNYDSLLKVGVKFLVSRKLSVYNGKIVKFVNLNCNSLETTLRCALKFGDLIFTRARYKFKKKKKKKKKK